MKIVSWRHLVNDIDLIAKKP